MIIKIKFKKKKKFRKFTAELQSQIKLKKQSQHKYNPVYQLQFAGFLWCLSLNETKTSIVQRHLYKMITLKRRLESSIRELLRVSKEKKNQLTFWAENLLCRSSLVTIIQPQRKNFHQMNCWNSKFILTHILGVKM